MKRYEIKNQADVNALAKHWDLSDELPPTTAAIERPEIQNVAEVKSIRSYAAQKIDFVIDGIVAAGTITMISGEPGCGKTTLATAMCSAIERGVPFAGLSVERRPVLILDRENPLPVLVERFDRLGITDGPNFKVWGGWAESPVPAPGSPIVASWVQACDPKPVILVDSFVAFNEGDENSSTDTREFFDGLRLLSNLGATLIVLHHSGKADSAKDYRGSSDIKAAIDTGYTLTNFGDSARLSTLRLKVFKARFIVEETVLHYTNDRFEVDNRPASKTQEETLRDLLIQNPGFTGKAFTDAATKMGVTFHRVQSFLKSGYDSGAIRVEPGKHNTKFHYWEGSETV